MTESGKERLAEALCILKDVDPEAYNDITSDTDPEDAQLEIVELTDEEALADGATGVHDANTIAVDTSCNPGEIAMTLAHENAHQNSAAAAGEDQDPETDIRDPSEQSNAEAVTNGVNHYLLYCEGNSLLCLISQANGTPYEDQAECPGEIPPVTCKELKDWRDAAADMKDTILKGLLAGNDIAHEFGDDAGGAITDNEFYLISIQIESCEYPDDCVCEETAGPPEAGQ